MLDCVYRVGVTDVELGKLLKRMAIEVRRKGRDQVTSGGRRLCG